MYKIKTDFLQEFVFPIDRIDKTFNISTSILTSEAKEGGMIEIFVNINKEKTDDQKEKINH